MNRICVLMAVIALSVSGARGMELAEKSKIRENIAVIDFEGKNVSEPVASIFSDFLRTELVKTGTFNVIEKANMDKILKEMAFQQTGVTSTEDAAKLGKILNARKMIIGAVAQLEDMYYITAKLVDVESANIDKSETLNCESTKEFPGAASGIAEKFSGVVIVERMAMGQKIWVVVSPKAGIFSPLDSVHGTNMSYGFDASLWLKRHGVSLDYDQYLDERKVSPTDAAAAYMRRDAVYYLPTVLERLSLHSAAIGYNYKFADNQVSYFYSGIGFGRVWGNLGMYVFGVGAFDTYYLKCGFKYKSVGATLKYSYTPTYPEWCNVNFQGISLFLNIDFMTAINLY